MSSHRDTLYKMSNNLLIVTADAMFAKRLSTSLEQEGYRLYVAKGKGEAVVRADEQNCSTAFLDLELSEKFVSELGRALRTLNPTKIRPPYWTNSARGHWLVNLLVHRNC